MRPAPERDEVLAWRHASQLPYRVREDLVRDPEGHLWSFQTPLTELNERETP